MANLILVGSGIKSIAHITQETKAIIKNVDKVLYLLNESHLITWIKRECKTNESLEKIYFSKNSRLSSYQAITNYIISEYSKYESLCVVLYGHPTVFANSGLWAVQKIKHNGGRAVILPAVSSLDCLFSDLAIDPGNQGCYFSDATEFLVKNKKFDVSSHLILFQVGMLGCNSISTTKKMHILKEYLLKFYLKSHSICFYEASRLPSIKSKIKYITIEKMCTYQVNALDTLYIPPLNSENLNYDYISRLGMSLEDFSIS